MRKTFLVLAAFAAACATPAAESPLDADPFTLHIEIGRYSALLGQVVEHTGVSYEHTALAEQGEELDLAPEALMLRLREAAADYNAVRTALCASKAGASDYGAIRRAACGPPFATWAPGAVTMETVARRSRDLGGPIIGLWGDVCDEARRLQKPEDADTPVCPME